MSRMSPRTITITTVGSGGNFGTVPTVATAGGVKLLQGVKVEPTFDEPIIQPLERILGLPNEGGEVEHGSDNLDDITIPEVPEHINVLNSANVATEVNKPATGSLIQTSNGQQILLRVRKRNFCDPTKKYFTSGFP